MSIISQVTWDNLIPKEEKDKIRRVYSEAKSTGTRNPLEYEFLFGKRNLQPKSKIKNWMDVLNQTDTHDFVIGHPDCDNKLKLKLEATYKIAKLIELGYGGMVTNEEWEERINEGTGFYTIVYSPLYKSFHKRIESCNKQFIAFHTSKQAEEFMAYPENVKLLNQYNLL